MIIHTIDTRHGTANDATFSHGNCLPYTGLPWGMNYFAPSTANNRGAWWFHPNDRTFEGYRITHQPSPWMGDFSHLTMTPISGLVKDLSLYHITSSYRPEEAIFNPTRLKITQCRYQITSELIPSMYGGLLDITYKDTQASENGLVLHLPGQYKVAQEDSNLLSLSVINFADCEDKNFTFYCILKTSQPFTISEQKTTEENGAVQLHFGDSQQISIHFATSFISQEQAQLNLKREQDWSKEDYLTKAEAAWEDLLSRIQIEHHNQDEVSTFYHNFYRTFLFPQTFYEYDKDNRKIHYDTTSKSIKTGPLYTNNGFWDTFRTVYPLYSLIATEQYSDMLEGFLNSYRETGFLPKWLSPDERGLMPGTLIDAVIADAASKEIRLDLMPEFLDAMIKGATVQSSKTNYGRRGTKDYLQLGYVPLNHHESVNHTLDYAFSDYCISQVAKKLGKDDIAQKYAQQAKNYRNIFDPVTGFMRAKDTDGNFRPDFLPTRWGRDYAEGSAWQTSWSVLHDFAGLISCYGSSEAFEKKLIKLCNQRPDFNVEGYGFEIHEMSELAALEFGQVAISNQPSFHYPYLFSYIGKPWMATPLLRQLMTETFNNGYEGYPGDEDNGTTAAWYIFSSLGFYPVTAASNQYVLGIPLWDKAIINLSSGKQLTIIAQPNAPQQLFVDHIDLNKKTITETFLNHDDIIKGGELSFELGIVPNPRSYTANELPYSMTTDTTNTSND